MTVIQKNYRLFLRRLRKSDLDRTWEWMHRRDINDKIGVQIPFTKEQQQQWYKRLQKDKSKIVFAICGVIDSKHIGNVSLDMIDSRHNNARFSIFIADKDVRGMGLGSEALSLLELYAHKELNLHKIWCKTDTNDSKVLRFYESLGFQQEAILKEHELKNGKYIDKIIMAKIIDVDRSEDE